MDKYYVTSIQKLNASIRDLVNQNVYTTVQNPTELLNLEERWIRNSEAVAYIEEELQNIQSYLDILEADAEELGLSRHPVTGKLMMTNTSNPRGCPLKESPVVRLCNLPDAYHELDRYLNGLQNRIPVYPAFAQYVQLNNFLLERKANAEKQIGIITAGIKGEERVMQKLQNLSFKYPIRSGVILPAMTTDQRTSETDAMMITPKGVFAIEIKNMKCEALEIYKDGSWAKVRNGEVVEWIGGRGSNAKETPSQQNAIHMINIRAFLEKHGFGHVPVISVITIARDDVRIQKNESKIPVMPYKELVSFIESYGGKTVLDQETMGQLADLFDRECLEENSFPSEFMACEPDAMREYIESLRKAFRSQRWFETSVGSLLNQTVDEILYYAPLVKEAEEIRQTEKIRTERNRQISDLVKRFNLLSHAARIPFAVAAYIWIFNLIQKSQMFYQTIHLSGYLSDQPEIANSSSSKFLYWAVILTALVAVYLLVWVLPRIVWRFVKNHHVGDLIRDAAMYAAAAVLFALMLRILANGVPFVSLIGYVPVLLLGYGIWRGRKRK